MASQVDVCNLALLKQAQDLAISAMTENRKEARVFSRVWSHARDLVLAAKSWPFALKAMPLELLVEDPFPGFEYRYAYPDDCITALVVCTEDGVRSVMSGLVEGTTTTALISGGRGAIPFQVTHGDQSTSIATDLSEAYLIYTARVENVARYSAPFADALVCYLAYLTAPSIMGELGFRAQGQLLQNYMVALSDAAAHALNQGTDDPPATTPSIAARGGC